MNLDKWLVAGAPAAHLREYVSDGDLAQLVSWRLTHVRLPIEERLLRDINGWLALDNALMRCARAQLAVVVALRWPDTPELFLTADAWRPLTARWTAIAARYRHAGIDLSFDLLDAPTVPDVVAEEVLVALGAPRLPLVARQRTPAPGATAGRAWSALAGRVTEAIRETGCSARLVVESVAARPEAFARLRPTRDANTTYSFHCFSPEGLTRRGEGTYPGLVDGEQWDRERLLRSIEPALAFAETYEAPLYVGAFGATSGAPRQSRLTWVRSLLSLCRAKGIGWAYWTYRDAAFGLAGGPSERGERASMDYDLLGVLQSE